MKGFSKIISFIFVLILVFTSACTNNTETTDQNDEESSDGTYVIKAFAGNSVVENVKYFSETPVGAVVKEKFNIDFEFVSAPAGGDIKQNWNLMLAGGNYPEIIYTQCECLETFKKYVNAGAVVALDPYLDDMPNFKKLYEEALPFWRQAGGDGKLYNWNVLTPQDKYNWLEGNDIFIRSDILEEAGYPELLTPDQYVDLLANAIKNHPETDGQKTIGMVAPFAESWGMAGIAPILYEKGYNVQVANSAVIWNEKDDVWEDMFTHPYVKESFKFLNDLYRAGALDPESFTDKVAQITEKLNSGRALASWYQSPGAANQELEKAGKEDLQYIELPIMSQGAIDNGEEYWTPLQATRPFDWVFITKNAKDPEKILEVVEWASSEEGQVLLQSGIEGVHYEIVDGKRFPTEEYLNGIDSDVYYKVKEGIGIVPFLGTAMINSPVDDTPYNLNNIPEIKDRNLSEREKEVLDAMGWESAEHWWLENAEAKPVGLAAGIVVDPTTEFGVLETQLTDFRVKNSARLIKAGSEEEFEKIYDELIEQYNAMDPQKLVDEYNRLYAEALKELEKFE